ERCSCCFFFSSRRRHTRFSRDWSSDVCSSDLIQGEGDAASSPDILGAERLVIVEVKEFSVLSHMEISGEISTNIVNLGVETVGEVKSVGSRIKRERRVRQA